MKLYPGQEHRLQNQRLFRALFSKYFTVSSRFVTCSNRPTIFQEESFELGEPVLFWGVFCSVIILIGFIFLFLGGHSPRRLWSCRLLGGMRGRRARIVASRPC